jgi:hypothetical protein
MSTSKGRRPPPDVDALRDALRKEEGLQVAGGPQNWEGEPPPTKDQLDYERDPTPDPEDLKHPARKRAIAPIDPPRGTMDVALHGPAGGVDQLAARLGRLKSEMKVYCFDGKLAQAPDWIDKNWAGFENDQNERGQGYAGPTLRIHDMNYEEGGGDDATGGLTRMEPVFVGVARVGDYIVREDVDLGDGKLVVGKVRIIEAAEAKRLGLVH